MKDKKSKRRRGDRGVSIKDIINNINVRLGFMVHSWKSFLFNSILKLWEIFRKIIFNYGKNLEKIREMTWLLTWLNESVATLNATLQLLVIYRLDESHLISSTSKVSLKKKKIGKVSDGWIRDSGFNLRLHWKLIGVLVWW